MRKWIFTLALGWLVTTTSGLRNRRLLGRSNAPSPGTHLHVGESPPIARRVGTVLAVGPAEPYDSLSHAWRRDITADAA